MESFDELAGGQRGLLLYDQGVELFGRRGLSRRVLEGDLLRENHGLYRVAGTQITNSLAMYAAFLLHGAVGSIGAAGFFHQFDRCRVLRPEVTVLGNFSGRKLELLGRTVTVHRTNVLPPGHLVVVDRLPLTSPARTICDLSRRFDSVALGKMLDDAARRHLLTYGDVYACRQDLQAQGRRRTTVLDEMLEARGYNFNPGESAPELKVRGWLEDAGMAPEIQVEVVVAGSPRRLDLAYAAERVAVEYHGIDAHANEPALIDDSRRTTDLQLAGWLVVIITKADTRRDVVRKVRQALELRRNKSSPS